MYEVGLFFRLVQGSSRCAENLLSLIAAQHDYASFQWGVTPSRMGLRCEYANYENGLWFNIGLREIDQNFLWFEPGPWQAQRC